MKKFKIFWDFEAEERFLNEMASKGHILKKYSIFGVYHFEDGAPQKLNYKVDYHLFLNKREFDNYRTLFEDAGWRHVCGSKYDGSQYFLPESKEAGTDIFSDTASALARYKTQYRLCLTYSAVFICYLVALFFFAEGNLSNLGFLTPGLWERTGAAFWSAFFFELPFVFLRVIPPILLAVVAVCYGYFGVKAKQYYRSRMKDAEKNAEKGGQDNA